MGTNSTLSLSLYEDNIRFYFVNNDDGILSDDMDNAHSVSTIVDMNVKVNAPWYIFFMTQISISNRNYESVWSKRISM